MAGYHTSWVRPGELAEDPERIAICEALAFGKAVYDVRMALGLTVSDLAERTDMSDDEIECIEDSDGPVRPAWSCAVTPSFAQVGPSVRSSQRPTTGTQSPARPHCLSVSAAKAAPDLEWCEKSGRR